MSKRKFNELNDIIDTAYVVADYSDSNRCYDYTSDCRDTRRDENIEPVREPLQDPFRQSRFGVSSGNPFRDDRGDRGDRGDTGNIFLKKSQNIFQSGFQNANKPSSENQEKSEINKVVLNDDTFPSLGSNSTKVSKPTTTQPKLNFKKVVEQKPEVVNKPEPKITTTGYKKSNYSQYSMYQEIREKSEMFAKWKIVDDVSSDDNMDDNYY